MGFFADVGPLTVFVSHQVRTQVIIPPVTLLTNILQLIHPDMKFDPNSNPPSFASEDAVSICHAANLHSPQMLWL